MQMNRTKALIVVGLVAVSSALAFNPPQVRELLKVLGVGAVVQRFGPDINKAINKLTSHKDTRVSKTKVVPILSVGSRQAIGAAQVMGPAVDVDKVNAVAQLDQDIFGREVKIRALVPITSKDVLKDLRRVENVGISGIVDLKL
jgi:hypothetical protein